MISPSSSPLGPSSFSRSGRAADDLGKGHRNSNEASGHGGPAPWGYAETEGLEFWGALAVVGVMMQAGRHNDPLASVFASMPAEAGPEVEIADTAVDASAMLPPDSGAYFHYKGSLTTTPCSEGVRWFVLANAIEVSAEQIDTFEGIFGPNARPLQRLNDRLLIASPQCLE